MRLREISGSCWKLLDDLEGRLILPFIIDDLHLVVGSIYYCYHTKEVQKNDKGYID